MREIARKLSWERLGIHLLSLQLYQRVLSQKRGDSNKIYSLHEPDVKCCSKGKEHKKFEFGSKASILIDQGTGNGHHYGALNFSETLHDSKTLPEVLEQFERLNVKEVIADRGYKGIKDYKASKIYLPRPDKNITKKQRCKHRKKSSDRTCNRTLKIRLPVMSELSQRYQWR